MSTIFYFSYLSPVVYVHFGMMMRIMNYTFIDLEIGEWISNFCFCFRFVTLPINKCIYRRKSRSILSSSEFIYIAYACIYAYTYTTC